ncbi:proteasome subunit beta type [Dorcoceras hygrometricum]|uniref:Proteasome subunit beta type n=1 Tax=Dorcoceras hygrometricum TaxID=472368 RepID=A0A2Z7AFI3_9LAMI|nr:proteasome subunit beta type [Dorcoceras hygrometricum]
MIRRLRAQLATERRVSAVIREELDKRAASMNQELELLAEANSQNKEDKEKLETSQATIAQLSTVSNHLAIQAQNLQAQWQNVEDEFRQYRLQAETKIRLFENDVRVLIHENANMLNSMQAMHEEELEEDLVEAEGAMEATGAPGDGEILE